MLAARFNCDCPVEIEQALGFTFLFAYQETRLVGEILGVSELAEQMLAADQVEMKVLCTFLLFAHDRGGDRGGV